MSDAGSSGVVWVGPGFWNRSAFIVGAAVWNAMGTFLPFKVRPLDQISKDQGSC